MSKKLLRNIVLSVVCLAILGGCYIWVTKLPEPTDNPETNTDIQTISLFKTDYKNITHIHFQNESGQYSIEKTADSKYTIPQFPKITFSNTKLSSAVMDFAGISALKEISGENSLSNFASRAQVSITTDDGVVTAFTLGNEVIGDNGYFMKTQDGKCYVISSYKAESFLKDINDYRDTALATIDTQTFKALSVFDQQTERVSIRAILEDEKGAFHKMASFVMTHPHYAPVNGDGLTPIMEKFPADISVVEFTDNNIANASKYGIGALTVIIEDDNGTYKLSYGNKDENGNVYTVFNDGNFIFTQKPALYDLMNSIEPRALLDKFAHLINIDEVASVTIEGGGKSYQLSISGEGDNASYAINGVSSNEEYFKKAYQAIIGIQITEVKTKAVSSSPEYTVTFRMRDGSIDKSEYLPYDDRNYLLSRNGHSEYIILKKNLSAAMDTIGQYVGSN